ncbi:helix-turn-helix domain-containing protein [Formosa sp. S-31]|uniref:helix-turn-helix domain-containing protein n=1 Tax=Formosa sp. S-31 TaxID=2790949 RepID=UPI003EC0B2DE
MKLFVKFDYQVVCKRVLESELERLNIPYTLSGLGEIETQKPLRPEQQVELTEALRFFGISLIQDEREVLVQRIKDIITEMIYDSEEAKAYNTSTILSEKLEYSYSYLSTIFSEVTYNSIENFVMLKKIDLAKELMSSDARLTLTEIAHRLNYSSVAHLSGQFKKITGLTPSTFQKIIEKRRQL